MLKDRVGIQIVASRPEYLGMLLTSLRTQTLKNWDLFIVIQDEAIVKNHFIQTITKRLDLEGHKVHITVTKEQGIGNLRNIALNACDTEIGVRIDDDSICEPDYLELLYYALNKEKKNKVGVVGGTVPFMYVEKQFFPIKKKFNEVTEHFVTKDDSTGFYNVNKLFYYPADHNRSAYMYYNETMRKVGFPTLFDELAGFREETLPCIHLSMMGYKHFFVPNAVAWHFGAPTGGTRPSWKKIGTNGQWGAEEKFLAECNRLRGELCPATKRQ